LWHLAKTSIDRRLQQAQAAAGHDAAGHDLEEARRQARLRTLLPIARNLLGSCCWPWPC
jgi:hypothetical protein